MQSAFIICYLVLSSLFIVIRLYIISGRKFLCFLLKLNLSYNRYCSSTRPIYKKMTKIIYLWRAQKEGPNDVNDGTNYRLNIG